MDLTTNTHLIAATNKPPPPLPLPLPLLFFSSHPDYFSITEYGKRISGARGVFTSPEAGRLAHGIHENSNESGKNDEMTSRKWHLEDFRWL